MGSIIAKDSFAVARSGWVLLGPVFALGILPTGLNYVSGDWRYNMVRFEVAVSGTTIAEFSACVR